MTFLSVSSEYLNHPREIAEQWQKQQAVVDCSFFQSWGWIGTWLENVVTYEPVIAIQVCQEQKLVGLGLLVVSSSRRRLVMKTKCLVLNDIPDESKNMIIEYNGLLCEKKLETEIHIALFEHVAEKYPDYEEIRFNALGNMDWLAMVKQRLNGKYAVNLVRTAKTWQVNLDAIDNFDSYLASMKKNTRWQIRRTHKLYSDEGEIGVQEAQDLGSANEYFNALKELHTQRWNKKGESGSFGNVIWERFHRELISRCFPRGEVQLLKIGNANTTIGYVYNFVWRGGVYMLQTGIDIPTDNRMKPGYLMHVLTAIYNKGEGNKVYDFMYGDARYKISLSNQQGTLYWIELQQPKMKFMLENAAVKSVRVCRSIIGSIRH